ncbi:hypothetical protein COV16_07200 [Candidatus Woesearchaeota archaeon CG10_big_fil_rev_8_21_14_0_10_34_8]|nr:MAG: hypothetical protein COV16_07200 [Candidatus Woesearchaeota archaeon CG10_big_fil_rev_8_21_14_0_10_34_8]
MNITKLTEEYVATRPSLKDCLAAGFVNYSAVSREIILDLKLNVHIDAVIIALRRYKEKLQKTKKQENKIRTILKKSNLNIKNKIVVAIIDKRLYYDYLLQLGKKIKNKAGHINIIEGTSAVTIVTDEEFLSDIETLFKGELIEIQKNLVQITLHSPPEIEIVPGVYAYLISLFAHRGVNIVESMSCWTDTVFVIAEEDAAVVMNFLTF